MPASIVAFWLVFTAASTSFAPNVAYSQFPAASAETCATACSSDKMCASWSFGGAVRIVETTKSRRGNIGLPPGMCALSDSLTPARRSGFVSGLPRRSGAVTPAGRFSDGPANYEVRPAPWLDSGAPPSQPAPAYNQGAPIATPSAMPPTRPESPARLDFMPAQPITAQVLPVELGSPDTRARGTPAIRAPEVPSPLQSGFVPPRPVVAAPPNPRSMSHSPPPAPKPTIALEPIQSQATPQPAADLSEFRDANGMIDAAAMRRSQIISARATGQPAYAVQREWEAVEEARQRAAANGVVRADLLAGTVPVLDAPKTKSVRSMPSFPSAGSGTRSEDGPADQKAQKPAAGPKGARGTPQSNQARQSALADDALEPAQNPSYIDREPRLSGGPDG